MKISNSKKQLAQIIHENGGWCDWWIEWNGGACPVDGDTVVEIKTRDGEIQIDRAYAWNWSHERYSPVKDRQIISYRLHKPEQAKPESDKVEEAKPTIEQLASDYRNLKDFADRKQQEADAAKADAEAKLAELVAAGKALGLVLSVAEPELEPGITDWRDLLVGDEVECVRTPYGASCTPGMFGVITEVTAGGVRARFDASLSGRADGSWFSTQGGGFRFIRRPAKGAANA